MTDFRMNKEKPIGSKTLSTIAGYTPHTRPKPTSPEPKQAFEVTPDLTEEDEVEVVSVAEALGEMITPTETVNEEPDAPPLFPTDVAADGVVKTGIEIPTDGKEYTTTLGKDEDDAIEPNKESK